MAEGQQLLPQWDTTIVEELRIAGVDRKEISKQNTCIYKVPRYLREADHKAFTPSMISIGPYHHQASHLLPMERHKWRAFHMTVKRWDKDPEPNFDDFMLYFNLIKNLEEEARGSYEDDIDLDSNDFVKMMVLDGCFILELFRGILKDDGFEKLGYVKGDPVFSICGTLDTIRRDMVKLENQIPMLILNALFVHQTGVGHDVDELVDELVNMGVRFFAPLIPTDKSFNKDQNLWARDLQPLHCLHLFREILVNEKLIKDTSDGKRKSVVGNPTTQVTYCVSQLREGGIRFKKHETDQFWNIKYKNSILEIPRILIHDGTKSIFRNLVAFEECYPKCRNVITVYLVFMNNLIDSAEDVGFLNRAEIIEHWLGDDNDVADLFNTLGQEVAADLNSSYLSGLTDRINKCRHNPWSTWKADLRHKYFKNPWASFSVIAAILLLLLTLLQTFYSVYSYYKAT